MSMLTRYRGALTGLAALSFPVIAVAGWITAPVDPSYLAISQEVTPKPDAAAKPKDSFATVKAKADRAASPSDGIVIWQKFIDSGITGDDLEKANAEMKIWKEREADDAEIMNRKWVGGKEKEKITNQVNGLLQEFASLAQKNQLLEAIKKLEEAKKVWPENFAIQFELGGIALDKRDLKAAIPYYEACVRINPSSGAVLNNLGCCYVLLKKWDQGIAMLHKSVEMGDNKINVHNLLSAFAIAPDGIQRSNLPKYKKARDAANLLADKYGAKGEASFIRMSLKEESDNPVAGDKERKGVVGNGSGFVLTPDGLILTNKHVAGGGKGVMIKFNDGTQKTGEIVVIDDEQDLALVRVKSDAPLSYVHLAKYDSPSDGAVTVVMGFPLTTKVGFAMKTTQGIVSAGNNAQFTSDVTLDAKVNPGNSGGPVYDQYGNVMAIIAQKTIQASGMEDSYGLAISNGRIRKFLAKNNITLEPGEDGVAPLTVQQISERNRMATVCILIVN